MRRAKGPIPGLSPRPAGSGRAGHTVLEGLLVCLLIALVLPPLLSGLAASRRSAEALVRRSEANATARAVFVVTGEELRRGGGLGEHARVLSAGVLELRAFRGSGTICSVATHTGGELESAPGVVATIAYLGTRLPDPQKDSVEAVLTDGRLWRSALAGASGAEDCAVPGRRGLRITLTEVPPASPILFRFFERGEYHLANQALRYRLGRGGRQPLTPERIGAGALYPSPSAPASLRVRLQLSPDLPGHTPRSAEFSVGGGG